MLAVQKNQVEKYKILVRATGRLEVCAGPRCDRVCFKSYVVHARVSESVVLCVVSTKCRVTRISKNILFVELRPRKLSKSLTRTKIYF